MIKIEHYLLENGSDPFDEWLQSLKDTRGKAKIKVRLRRMSLGNFGDHKSLGDGIAELRLDVGPGYRIYYGIIDNLVVLLLCGGAKSSQEKDIKTAKKYWLEYKKEFPNE